MDVKSIFVQNLKLYRKEKLSQEQLSEKVDISVKHLSSIERCVNFVSADLLERLADSIRISAFYFFVDKQEIFYNVTMLNMIDKIVEKRLMNAIEEIKADIRQNQS